MLTFIQLFPDAFICGLALAATCGAVGVFVVLRRIAFVSVAVSEAATCGVAVGLSAQVSPAVGSAAAAALALAVLEIRLRRVSRDVVLAAVFLFAASLSILLVAKNGFGLEAVKAMLVGDLIVCGVADRWRLVTIGGGALALLFAIWRPLVYTFFDRECAEVMGLRCRVWESLYLLILWAVISCACTSGGALLVFCALVVTPATVLLFARHLVPAMAGSALLGCLTVSLGLFVSYRLDLPANPLIITLDCVCFAGAFLLRSLLRGRFSGGAGGRH